jgi:phosphate transport system protein
MSEQHGHTVKVFDSELKELSREIVEMGGLVEQQIADAIDSLVEQNMDQAQRVIAGDPQIDRLQREIEEKAVLTIARRQPMAIDLRETIAALRIANELERMGDYAKNIAKRVLATGSEIQPLPVVRGLQHMAELVLAALKQVLDAYSQRDVAKALEVWRGDEETDAVYDSLFRELLTYMLEDPRNITFCTHLLFCAKNIERIGDHATNIAETVYYIVQGVALEEERPKGGTRTMAPVAPTG